MSKAPTVSDVVSNVVLVGSFAAPPPTPFAHESTKDLDMEVKWKPKIRIPRARTFSVDSGESDALKSPRSPLSSVPESPSTDGPRPRRMSITEMIFGSSPSWMPSSPLWNDVVEERPSATKDDRFKEILKHNNQMLGLDDSIGGFKRKDYMK